jgi:hypothetical protein
MKCPVCSAEIEEGATQCPVCQAFQTVERTPMGVLTGWLGLLSTILTAMMVIPLPIMLIAGSNLQGFPWILPAIGTVLAVGFLLHSRSTRHIVWLESKSNK